MAKKIIFSLMILSILFLCGPISAADADLTNETLSADNDMILEESSNDLSSDVDFKTFKDLNEEITNKTQIDLDSDYIYTNTSDDSYKNGIIIDKTVVINGHGFKINSTNESKLFDVKQNGNLVLNDLILLSDYGNTNRLDGSFKNAGTVTLNNVTFITTQTKIDKKDSLLSSSFYNTGELTIKDSKFVNSTVSTNRQTYFGLIYNNGILNIENTLFDNNRLLESTPYDKTYATNLISNEKELFLRQVNVTNNYMKTYKTIYGMIRSIESTPSNIIINNSFFKNNHVLGDKTNVVGTIVWTNSGTLTILNSKFINTTGATGAGTIYSTIPNIFINNTFEKSIVSDSGKGGAIYSQGTSTFINNTFIDNSAYEGGAIYCTEDLQTSTSNLFKGNVFINNKAANQGGAIYSGGSMGTETYPIEDNVFINNEAGDQGGAIFLRNQWVSKSIFATKSIFQENYARGGGSAIYNYPVSGSNIANITYSIFYDNYRNTITSGTGSSSEYNYWGTNTPEFNTLTKFTPTHIAIIAISGDANVKYSGEYIVNFKDNATNETLKKLPNFTVDVKSTLNTITPKSIVISNEEAILKYNAEKTGIDNIRVMKDGEELANLNINVSDIIKTPSFNITANNVNEGENLDLRFSLTNGPEGNEVYTWTIFDENNTIVETGFVQNNQIKYTKTYLEGKYLININLSNVEGWKNLDVNDSFEVIKANTEPSTNTTGNQTNADNQGDSNQKEQKTTNTKKITPKIIAKNKTFKASKKVKKYTITLKADKKPLSKVKVTLKIKGKTYKATTNKKGKATFKIKKLIKKGKYKAIITYKGNKTYNKVTKKVTITIKK